MPPEKKVDEIHHNSLPSTSTAASVSRPLAFIPLPELPEEIIVSILKRLPVKSILRFKCVCKEWFSLFSSPKFISMHHEETSNNQLNHSLIIPLLDKDHNYKISLLNVNSTQKGPISLANPFSWISKRMDLVGSVNGLVCLSYPPLGETVILCNPAMNLYKTISIRVIPILDETIHGVSMGFAYDSANADYKIIRIASLMKISLPEPEVRWWSRVAVYSARLDSWKSVEVDFPYIVTATTSNVIVNGILYWTGLIYKANNPCKFSEVMVYYDVRNGLLKHVSVPRILTGHDGVAVQYVEWKGNLGVIVFSPILKADDFVQLLVYDETGMCWNKISSHGLIELKVRRPIKCSEDGMFVSESKEGELMLYDPVTNGFKTFCVPGALGVLVEAYSYSESLVTIKGMEQVKHKCCLGVTDYYYDKIHDVAALFSSLDFD